MRLLLRFIIKNHFGILFIVLEVLAFVILLQNNRFQKSRYMNMVQKVNAHFHQMSFRVNQFVHLKEENERLVDENIMLRDKLANFAFDIYDVSPRFLDTNYVGKFDFIPAKVINNSVNKQYNFLTINKGAADGVRPEMAVISSNGVVGKVKSTSQNFSVVISLLNRDFMISSKLKESQHYGPVAWEGGYYKTAYLKEIPFHVEFERGDTVVTSGFSMNFPENIDVGVIEDFEIEGGNYFRIKLNLMTDFKQVTNVYIISNKYREEIKALEQGN
jgi:rod shape-determining protein MreC